MDNYATSFFKQDKFFELTNVEILEVDSDHAKIGLKIEPKHTNAHNVLHGGMLFTLADAAFGVLAHYKHGVTVTQSAQINYIAPADCAYVTATAIELVRNGRNCIHQVIITNEAGTVLCTATLNGFIKDIKK